MVKWLKIPNVCSEYLQGWIFHPSKKVDILLQLILILDGKQPGMTAWITLMLGCLQCPQQPCYHQTCSFWG